MARVYDTQIFQKQATHPVVPYLILHVFLCKIYVSTMSMVCLCRLPYPGIIGQDTCLIKKNGICFKGCQWFNNDRVSNWARAMQSGATWWDAWMSLGWHDGMCCHSYLHLSTLLIAFSCWKVACSKCIPCINSKHLKIRNNFFKEKSSFPEKSP